MSTTLQGFARFHIERKIADTLQGRVYLATDLVTNKHVVVKEAWRQLVYSGYSRNGCRITEDFLKERKLIMMLSNLSDCPQGLVKGIDEWEDQNCYYYAMEYCECELFDYISKNHRHSAFREFVTEEASKEQIPMQKPNKWVQNVTKIFYELCQSVQWLHNKGLCHLDISLENTMISNIENLNVKIIDFGLIQHFKDNFNYIGRIGKVQYMCPEAYAMERYDARAADVYCLGVMLSIMLIGAPIYQIPQPQNAAFNYCISGRIKDVLKHWKRLRLITEDALDLLNKIFRYESERITLDQMLNHSFFSLFNGRNNNVDSFDSDSSGDYPLINNHIIFKPSEEYEPVSFMQYDSLQLKSNHVNDYNNHNTSFCDIICSLQKENEQMQKTIDQQKQFIKALQFSNQGLIMTAQISQISHKTNTNKKKNKNNYKKRHSKKQQNQILRDIYNKASYDPSPNHRARKYINITKQMTQEIIPSKMGGKDTINWYKYMEKAIALQLNDFNCKYNINQLHMVVINYDFCDESGHEKTYYCIIERELDSKKTEFQWFMHDKLYSAKEIKILNDKIIICPSSRTKLMLEINNIDRIKDIFRYKYEQIMNIKWYNIIVFKRNNNKSRMVLRIEYQYMTRIMVECVMKYACDINKIVLIPIVIFNNYSHWIEWIWIVRIYECVDIGISFVYNSNGNVLKVTGIHLDKELIKEQHILALPHHIYKCECFDNWISYISDIEICADLNDNENKIKAYKQKYQSLKSFIYEFIDEVDDNYQSLKDKANSLIKYDNGSLNV